MSPSSGSGAPAPASVSSDARRLWKKTRPRRVRQGTRQPYGSQQEEIKPVFASSVVRTVSVKERKPIPWTRPLIK